MRHYRPYLATTAIAAVLCGCAPQIHLSVPVGILSEDWSPPVNAGTQPDQMALSAGLAMPLGGPALTALVERARTENPDNAIAMARVARARAQLGGARAASLPEMSISAGTSKRIDRQGTAKLDFGAALARLDVSWDPDLFGRLRAEKRASAASLEAAKWEQRQVALAIEVEVARAWVQRAVLARRIEILDAQIARARELERVVRARFDAGDATRIDLGLQTIRVLDLRRNRTRLVQALDETRTALAILVGAEAPLFHLAEPSIDDLNIPSFRPSPPAILLAARPDVRAAEAQIIAANGDVGAARARFFPQISLSLSGLAEAISGTPLRKVVTAGSDLLAPIFSRGTLTRDLRIAEAQQVETVETYRRTVLGALAQVEDLLSAADSARARATMVEQILAEARITTRLGNAQYLSGEEDLNILLDAEELLGDAEEARILVLQEIIFAQIGLYLAAGGTQASVAAVETAR